MTARLVLCFFLVGASGAGALAQDRPVRAYGELLGNGGGGSVNAEIALGPSLAIRGGAGYMPGIPATTRSAVSVPLMLVWLPGGETGFELGAGATLRYRTTPEGGGETGFADTFPTATLGYRWTNERGSFYRLGLTPLLGWPEGNREMVVLVPLVGVSVGVTL